VLLKIEVPDGPGGEKGTIEIHAKSGSLTQDATIDVQIPKAPTTGWLPPEFQAAGKDTRIVTYNGRKFYEKIQPQAAGLQKAIFILVHSEKPDDLPPYYLMRNLVSNELYVALTNAPDREAKDQPAFNLTADQADAAARKLHGRLPTFRQLDKAIGFVPGSNQTGLVGDSPYGIQDFNGKGWEYTRNLIAVQKIPPVQLAKDATVPLPNAPEGTLVILRGRRLNAKEPLTFEKLREQQTTELMPVQTYGLATPFTGFRIVIETEPPK
jgi:hypothetical protein